MSKKYKAKTAAVFNGQPVGSTIELDDLTAKKYEALKYLEIIEEVKKPKPKKKAPVKKTKSKAKSKSDK